MMRMIRKPCMRATHAAPNAASRRGILAVMAELYGGTRLHDDEAMAERERLHRDAEARLRRQGELRLLARGRG